MMTFKRIIFVLIVAIYSLVRGRAMRAPKTARKVLVVQMAKLGDMVCTTPMFRALKTAHLETQVYVLGSAINKQVLEGNADIDGYIVFRGLWNMVKRLHSEKFDAAFLAGGPDHASLTVTFLAGIPLIVGPEVLNGTSPLQDIWYRLLLHFITPTPHRMGTYAPGEYLKLLSPIGIDSTDTKKYIYATTEGTAHMKERLSALSHPRIGMSPGAGNKIKEWPPERFAELADLLIEKHQAQILIFGGTADKREVEGVLAQVRHPEKAIDMRGISIDELKAAIGMIDLFVSADTGPVYIAEAHGIATVDIVGPMDEREQPPRGPRNLIVLPPNRTAPALHIMSAKVYDVNEARRQAEATPVSSVFEACEQLVMSAS
jgi:heptosyltransferase-2